MLRQLLNAACVAACLLSGGLPVAAATRDDVIAWIASPAAVVPPDAGTTLTQADMATVAAYLPPGYAQEFDFPALKIDIEAVTPYAPHESYQEASATFAGQATLAADDALEHYTAGKPFSDAQVAAATPQQAGVMIAWNRIHRWQYYGWFADEISQYYLRGGYPDARLTEEGLNGGGKLERHIMQNYKRVYLNRLAMLAGQGYKTDAADSGERLYKDHVEFLEPFEVKGTTFVIERPLDVHEEDQVNSYLPTERRVRRLSAQERADVFMGSDMTIDDFEGYSGRVLDFEWTYLGKREVLSVVNARSPVQHMFGPSSRVPADRWQIRSCHAIELKPKFAGHPYSSKIIFFDVETMNAPVAIAINRDGQVWRIFSALYYLPARVADGVEAFETSVPRWTATIATDVLKDTSTVSISHAGTINPTMTRRAIEHQFNVSTLTSGR